MSDPDAPGYWDREDDRDEPWPPDAEPGALMMATPQLLELAAAVRGPSWRDQLAPALIAAQTAGWDWQRRALAACRLIFDPGAEPRALTDATRDPVKRAGGPSEPGSEWRQARQALERRAGGAA